MNKTMLKEQRKRLLEVSVLMEGLGEATDFAAALRDAVRELSFVCAELLQDAEDRERVTATVPCPENRLLALDWLRALPVGTELLDKDRDRWCKKGPDDWRCYNADEDTWDSGASGSGYLTSWHPFVVVGRAEEPEPRDAEPMHKIKVGDVLNTAAQLEACPDETILRDVARDVWLRYGTEDWRCTQPEANAYRDYSVDNALDYTPYTVVWLPPRD